MPRTKKALTEANAETSVLTVTQAAAFLNVERRTVLKLLNTGQLRGAKIGSDWRIRKTELDRLLDGGANPESGQVG